MNKKERKNKKTKNLCVNSNTNNQFLISKSGITLIALILTIIILLILAMVSISYIMRENIIKHAETAANQYQIEAEKEAIELAYGEYAMDKVTGKSDATLTVDGADSVEQDGKTGSWTVTFPNGNVYTVDKNGNITGPTIDGGDGGGGSNPSKYTIKDIEKLSEGEILYWDGDEDGTEDEWIIFNKDDEYTEIISKNTMGALNLGLDDTFQKDWENDSNLKEKADVFKEDGEVDYNERALYSYNYAIKTINDYCKSLITGANSIDNATVRSIGLSTEKEETMEKVLDGCNIRIKDADNESESETDFNKMVKLGIAKSGDEKDYWYASRRVIKEKENSDSFRITSVGESGELSEKSLIVQLWYDGDSGYGDKMFIELGGSSIPVRPIVTIPISE